MLIETLIASGLKMLAGAAVSKGSEWAEGFIKEKTGIEVGPTLKPEEVVRLQELEMQYADSLEKAYLGDVQDARGLQKAALQQEDKFSKQFIYWYATAVTILTFIYIFLITFLPIPEKSIRFADTILGFLLGVLISTITNYFFGSSKSSNEKHGIITEILKKVGAAQ